MDVPDPCRLPVVAESAICRRDGVSSRSRGDAGNASAQQRERSPAVLLPAVGRLALSMAAPDGARSTSSEGEAGAGGRCRERRLGRDAHAALPFLYGDRPGLAPGLEQLVAEQCSANFQVVDLLRGDDLPTEAFDVIVCFSVLEHIRDLARAARQRRHVCVRVTVRRGDGTPNQKPGGASQNRERAVRAGYPLAMHPSADPER